MIVVTNGQTVSYNLPSGVDVEEIEIKDGHLYVGGVDKGAIDGTNGSIVTVNEDSVLMIDGKEAGLKVGTEVIIKDASNGVYTISINGETIQLPMASAGLVSISPLGDDENHTANIYYGLLTKDVEWDGAKAVDGILKKNMDIIGGDPINVDAAYNNALKDNFIYIDYVDADGKSCIYGVDSKDLTILKAIKKLRVYFIAGTYVNGIIHNDNDYAVKLPYYTVSGDKWRLDQGFALPLDNAFRVRVATAKNEQTVASYTFTFELTMPECPVTRVKPATETSVQWGKWTADNQEWDLLKVYGELDNNTIYGDLRDAFTNVFTKNGTAYTATKEASYYTFETAMIDASESEMLIDATTNGITVNLAQIEAVSTWADWNTKDTKFAKNA